ncbi:MAG: RluA family pseudouridine synthase [Syntrophomonadaceae bacterium]|nr:RluA family pseudouridine synthase [Syntrophomonadaceae bacterium]
MEVRELLVGEGMEGERLDTWLALKVPELSRSQVKSLIEDGLVLVGGQVRKPGYRVKPGEHVEVRIPPPRETRVEAQDIPLNIIYEDQDVAVIDKPQGMVVHPAHGHWDQTLVNALLYQVRDLSGINGEIRPGIVHRLDKDTSGILVVAKNDRAHQSLSSQIKARSMKREYIALVHGVIKEQAGTIQAPIGRSRNHRKKMAVVKDGRPAVTHYEVLRRYRDYTLVRVRLETGRTHQIRVHFSYIGHPVVGDVVYGPSKPHFDLVGQLLHARYLGFKHPVSGAMMEFTSPLPEYFATILQHLERSDA